MIFKQFFDPVSSTFTYVLAKSQGAEALIIDPVLEQVDTYLKFLGDNYLKLVVAMDTHVHADHKTGLGKLRQLTRCMTCLGHKAATSVISRRLRHGDKISIDGITLDVLETQGHTDDSCCYYMQGMVFTGDTLFIRGNGRTDFQNGDSGELYDSLKKKIFTLPDDTVVWPGHDYKGEHASTIGKEKQENPRYAGKSRQEFIDIMDNLNLANPQLMDIAVPFNHGFADDIDQNIDDKLVLSCQQVKELNDPVLIDLRDQNEVDKDGLISGSLLIPLRELEDAIDDPQHVLNSGKEIVFYCAHGERSALGLELALEKEIKNVKHMRGGINAWHRLIISERL